MSRHRRQASQVLPPEFIAGDDPLKAFDLSDLTTSTHGATKSTSGTIATAENSPANPKPAGPDASGPAQAKKPPAGRSA